MFSNKCFNLPSKVNFRSICCRLDCKRKLCKEAMVGHILRPPVKLLLVWPQKFLSKVSLIQSFLWTILKAFLEPSHAYKLSNIFGKIAVNRSDSKWISAYPILYFFHGKGKISVVSFEELINLDSDSIKRRISNNSLQNEASYFLMWIHSAIMIFWPRALLKGLKRSFVVVLFLFLVGLETWTRYVPNEQKNGPLEQKMFL